jgi:phosphatidylethanolamine-binding protein (PEBP) family uncharacterized protein
VLENLPEQLGRALQGQRAGLENIALYRLLLERHVTQIELDSLAFEHLGALPARYTADGEGTSPPLAWRNIHGLASVVVLMVEDADSPTPRPLVHAIAVNLERAQGVLAHGSLVEGALLAPDDAAGERSAPADEFEIGLNSFLKPGWLPPDPPPGHGEHRYAFQLFALREGPAFSHVPGRQELFDAIMERAVAAGCLIGTYERQQRVKINDTATANENTEQLAAEAPGAQVATA